MRNIACAVALAALALSAHGAQANKVLHWTKVPVAAPDEKTCLAFARKVGKEKFTQMKEGPNEVTGVTDKARGTIICFDAGKTSQGIIMTTGVDSAASKQLRDDIAAALKGTTSAN